MKKKVKNKKIPTIEMSKFVLGLLLCIFFVYLVVAFRNPTFLKSAYRIESNDQVVLIPLPKFSYLEEKQGDTLIFLNMRGTINMKKEMDSYLLRLEKKETDNDSCYYDKEQNLTLLQYRIEPSSGIGFFHRLIIEYELGNSCAL